MIQEFRSSFRLLLQTTELLVGTVFPLLLLTCGRCVLFFDVVEKKLFSVFFFFNFQMWSLRDVVVLLFSSLNDDLCRLNLVLNSFSVSPIVVSCFFVSVSFLYTLLIPFGKFVFVTQRNCVATEQRH